MEETLQGIERKLDALIDAGNMGWAKAAMLIMEVERLELWKSAKYRSMSAWLREYAQRKKCSESLLWKYAKAGRYYIRAMEEDPDLPPLEDAKVSALSVVTAEKICGEDTKRAADLLFQASEGEIKSKDIQDMWRAARKTVGTRKTRHDKVKAPGDGEARGTDTELTARLTQALARDAETWIWGAESLEEAEERKRREAPRKYLTREDVCVRTLTEFPVRVESAERARRIDLAAVCIENQTTADWMEVTLRGVEVKVSEYDLARDEKMGDYAQFMDYMSIAVPVALAEQAGDAVPLEWGVLAYDPDADSIDVVREPERLDAPRREEALMTACVKMAKSC